MCRNNTAGPITATPCLTTMRHSDAVRHHKRRQDSLKKRSNSYCKRWSLHIWIPVSILVLLAVCMYLKDHPSDMAHWRHLGHLSTSEKNLTYYYKASDAHGLHSTKATCDLRRAGWAWRISLHQICLQTCPACISCKVLCCLDLLQVQAA